MSKDDMWPEQPAKPKNLTEQYNFMEMLRQKSMQLDSATTSYIKQQMDYIQSQGLDPRDYEVILCSDEFPKFTDDGLRITQRIRLVKEDTPPPKPEQGSSLDEKLDELSIWIEANRDVSPESWEVEIWPMIKAKFKQAFVDDGWASPELLAKKIENDKSFNERWDGPKPFSVPIGGEYISINKKVGDKIYAINGVDSATLMDGTSMKLDPNPATQNRVIPTMTGQEWFDKFEEACKGGDGFTDLTGYSEWSDFESAARKAAGIE